MTEWDGRPQNPERDGTYHWLRVTPPDGDAVDVTGLWESEVWSLAGGWGENILAEQMARLPVVYLSPCLTPAEIERLREALDHAAGFAMSLRLAEKCADPADLTDEMLRAACDAERAHDHASPCHFCPERCGNGNLAAALRAALRVKDTPTGLEYRGG